MITVLQTGDLHIGMENYGRLDPETGWSSRLVDFLARLDEMVERAIADRVDLFVITGDIYKSRDPSPTQQREFARRLLRLSQAGIETIIVAGNHDTPIAEGRATSIDIFRAVELPHITVSRRIDLLRIDTPSGPIQVLTLPWMTRGLFMARDQFRGRNVRELVQTMVDLAEARLVDIAQELNPEVPAIVVAHALISGCRVGSERLLRLAVDPEIPVSTVCQPGVDYVAVGHVHKYQMLVPPPCPIIYAGSIDRVDFMEENDPKGYCLAQITRGRSTAEFVPLAARRFLTITAELGDENPTQDVLRAIERRADAIPDAIVRLQLRGARIQHEQVDERAIRTALREAHNIAGLARDYTDATTARLTQTSVQGRTPLELLELYFDRRGILPDRRAELLPLAQELLSRTQPV